MREIARHDPLAQKSGVIGLVAGSLALAGVIPFAGYFSKEMVLGAMGETAGGVALALAYFGAGLTAYYTFRMVFLTLRGQTPRRQEATDIAPAPAAHEEHFSKAAHAAMAGPVLVLAALTLVLGYLGGFFATRLSPALPHEGPFHIGGGALVALALVAAGIALAWYEFGRAGALGLGFAERVPALKSFFGDNWYLDRLYHATVVRWTLALSRAAKWNDHTVLDGASDGVAQGTVWGGRILSMVQNGFVQAYVAVAISVVAALGIWLTRTGGLP